MTQPTVKLYALSTCSHCKAVKKLLEQCDVKFDVVEVDCLEAEERKAVLQEIKQYNKRLSFPTTLIGDEVIVGHKADRIKKALGQD